LTAKENTRVRFFSTRERVALPQSMWDRPNCNHSYGCSQGSR